MSVTSNYAKATMTPLFGAEVSQDKARNLDVSYRELREYAKAYRGHGWSPRESVRLARDHFQPYHDLFRSH
jgi:hypothetical protein